MNKMMAHEEVKLKLPNHGYSIYIAEGLLSEGDFLRECLHRMGVGKRLCIISNPIVRDLYLETLTKSLSGYQIMTISIPDGERYKNIQTLNGIYEQLLSENFNRQGTIIALGGGVVGDVSGFVAATWMRGVNYCQIPTTLLAQVDSSVGGKTGVNLPGGKNMVGAFHQPKLVLSDISTLSTLSEREFSAGMSEVIKYGLIYDQPFFYWLKKNIDLILSRDSEVLIYLIKRSCQIKAEIVSQDEREKGIRAILNFGHTFGHALESATNYDDWLHGEAIAVGMVCAAKLSARLGWIPDDLVGEIEDLFSHLNLPIVRTDDFSADQHINLMKKDKKSTDKGLPLVLLKSIGQAIVTKDYQHSDLVSVLKV